MGRVEHVAVHIDANALPVPIYFQLIVSVHTASTLATTIVAET